MAQLTLTWLGSPKIQLANTSVNLGRSKAVALLAYLATTQHPSSRDALATLLWPAYDAQQAFTYLRQMLWTINKTLGKEWLITTTSTVALNSTADLWIDVNEYRQLVRWLDSADAANQLPSLIQAAELYGGDFLAGFTLDDSPEFEQWQLVEATALRHTQTTLLATIVQQLTAEQAYSKAIHYAQRWLQLDPLHEPAHAQLIQLYGWSGQRSLAVRQYQECTRLLQTELGVPPPYEINQLYQAIVQNRLPPPVGRAQPAVIRVVERSSVSPAASEPSPPTASTSVPSNLPVAITPFIGREMELVQIGARLRDPTCRLLTLVGPGGIGKTRLAVTTAELLKAEFPDGVYFVALADLTDVDRLATTIANTLQFTLYRREEEPFQQLLNYLADKQLLLVLDNFEHLLAAATLTSTLLGRAPRVKILATSRERLNVQGEWLLEVSGLGYPTAIDETVDNLARDYSAAELFVRSAQRVNPQFALNQQNAPAVLRICQLVEGMPLALELAASWLRMLTCEEIATEIQQSLAILSTTQRDLPERHRSMRALFDYSWSLLSEPECMTLQQLSVLRGGFRREAAQAVAGASLPVLLALVDKSLVRNDGAGRFSLHELLRQFASQQLVSQPTEMAATHQRHMRYFTTLLDRQQGALQSKQQKQILGEVIADLENIRAAWRHAIEQQQIAILESVIDTLATVYELRAWFHEGETVFSHALLHCQEWAVTARRVLEGKLLARLGFFSHRLGKYAAAQQYLEQSYQLLQAANAPLAVIYTLNNLAEISRITGDYEQSERWLNESVALGRAHSAQLLLARALNILGVLQGARGEYATAQQLFQESLAIYETLEDPLGIAKIMNNLGILAFFAEDYPAAQSFYQRSLTINHDLGHDYDAAVAYSNLGLVAQKQGNLPEAVEIFHESLALQRKIGYELGVGLTLNMLGEAWLELGQLAEAQKAYYEVLHLAHKIHSTPLMLAGLASIAQLAVRQGDWSEATRMAILVQHHPSSEQETRAKVATLLEQAQAQANVTLPAPPPPEMLDQVLTDLVTLLTRQTPGK